MTSARQQASERADIIVRKYSCPNMIETRCHAQDLKRDIAQILEEYIRAYKQQVDVHEAWLELAGRYEGKTFWERLWG